MLVERWQTSKELHLEPATEELANSLRSCGAGKPAKAKAEHFAPRVQSKRHPASRALSEVDMCRALWQRVQSSLFFTLSLRTVLL